MLKRHNKNLAINIKPEIPNNKNIKEQFEMVKNYSNNSEYDKIFWIIDVDDILEKDKQNKSNKNLNKLKESLKQIKKNNNVITILNNPCFEFWFLLHYKQTTKFYENEKSLSQELKKYIPDYNKSKKYLTKENKDIYLILKDNLPSAIDNCKFTQRDLEYLTSKGIYEMDKLFNDENIKEIVLNNL